MHRELTGEGLVFKVGRFRESDCWVRLFSPALGLVTAFAFGGSKSRRRFCGCLDTLNRVLFKVRFFPVKGYYCLEEGTLLHGFPRLRHDLGRMGLAANCLQFVQAMQMDAQAASATHALLLETLKVLDQSEDISMVFPQLFRARICFDQGFAPRLGSCGACGRATSGISVVLALDQGRVFCPGCSAPSSNALRISGETHAILERISGGGPWQWTGNGVSRTARGELFQLVDGYVQCHLGLRWSQGRLVSA